VADSFLSGSEVWDTITSMSRRSNRGAGAIAVPWVSHPGLLDIRAGDIVVVDCSERALRVGSTDPGILADWVAAGAEVHSVDHLHAKVYVFGSVAVVTSANGSRNSELNLEEAAVRVHDRSTVRAARGFVLDLAGSARQLSESELRRLKRTVWAPPVRSGPLSAQAGATGWVAPRPGDTIWFAWNSNDGSDAAAGWMVKNQRRLRSRAGLRGVSWDWIEDDMATSPWTPGDVVCITTGEDDDDQDSWTAGHPCRVVSRNRVPGRRETYVYLLAYPATHDSVDWTDLAGRALARKVEIDFDVAYTKGTAASLRGVLAALWPSTCA
jgi:hypothetical protein